MDEKTKKAFEFAQDTTKQCITLAAGIIAVSITFAKDFVGGNVGETARWFALSAWAVLLLSVFFGLWTLMALTGTLEQEDSEIPISIRGRNVTLPAGLQMLTFFLGLLLTVLFGFTAILAGKPA